jgi:hypothetical protein
MLAVQPDDAIDTERMSMLPHLWTNIRAARASTVRRVSSGRVVHVCVGEW